MRGRNRWAWWSLSALAVGILAGLLAARGQLAGWRAGAFFGLAGLLAIAAPFWEATGGGEDDGPAADEPSA